MGSGSRSDTRRAAVRRLSLRREGVQSTRNIARPPAPDGVWQQEDRVQFFLKPSRTEPASEIDEAAGRQVVKRLRHEGRKLIEVFVLAQDGSIDRYQERTRRRLGSNAVASRTWLCETAQDDGWGSGRYIPEPADAIAEADPAPLAVVLVLTGAEGEPDATLEQLRSLPSATYPCYGIFVTGIQRWRDLDPESCCG